MFRLASPKPDWLKRTARVFIAAFLLGLILFVPDRNVQAAFLANRSIEISSAQPSAVASHTFNLTPATAGNIGSIVFEYCDSPVFAYPCSAPPGLDLTGATLTSQSGNTSFIIDSGATTANKLLLKRIPIPAVNVPSQYVFSGVINPSQADHVFFVRLSTYPTVDGSGAFTDSGSVAFNIASAFNVGASVPPFLRLCVGITVASDCSSAAGTSLDLGTFSSNSASAGQSQFAAGTNSINGYTVFVLGTTMTSGNNSIAANSVPTPSFPGNAQFGINLRANLNPIVGSEPSGPGTATPAAGYNNPNLFKFQDGDAVVSDTTPSDFNTMSVSYLVNIPSSQPGGVYSTTFTYLATATF